jgi:CRISPR-associated protein Cas2
MRIESCNLILTYDTGSERIPRLYRFLRQNLFWLQRSIFCGQVGKKGVDNLEFHLKPLIDPSYDSIYFFRLNYPFTLEIESWGRDSGDFASWRC